VIDGQPDQLTDPTGQRHDLYLGKDHWLSWFTVAGSRVGVHIFHPAPPGLRGCWGDGRLCFHAALWADVGQGSGNLWTLAGEPDERLTLTPSILCRHCRDHGWVTAGRWRQAA